MKAPGKPPTSTDMDSIEVELRCAGDRELIKSLIVQIGDFVRALDIPPEYRKYIEFGRAVKHAYAHRLSTCLAQKVADGLRPRFRGVLPDETGAKHESRSGSASGLKKLDVNYSNPQIGLGLGVSIKTLNFRDEGTGRFTKNIRRLDGELRAEAQDYHVRQPFSVLAALVFMPDEAAHDSAGKSSLRHAWEVFGRRSGRTSTSNDASLFERLWLCVYSTATETFGECRCFDIANDFPLTGIPDQGQPLSHVLVEIEREFGKRNKARCPRTRPDERPYRRGARRKAGPSVRRSIVPTVAYFLGIAVRMFFNDHDPPHFHVRYQQHRARVRIEDGELISGRLPPTVTRLVKEWAALRRDELMRNWAAARADRPLERIEGLE